MTDDIIVTDGLTRTFAKRGELVRAVSGVSINVGKGQIVALLGPNGAGKTTLFRMLATLLRPSGGTATIGGADVRTDRSRVRRTLGYVPQSSSSPTRALSVAEELTFACRLQGIDKGTAKLRVKEVMTAFAMVDLWDAELRHLSGGQRRRVEIALGLVHQPRVLLLDEPTTGLDPDAREVVWRHLESLRRREEISILISTHYLDEADHLADELVALNKGRVITRGAPKALKTLLAGDLITIKLDGTNSAAWPVAATASLPNVRNVESLRDRLVVTVGDAGVLLAPLAGLFRDANVPIVSIGVERASLRDVFGALVGDRGH